MFSGSLPASGRRLGMRQPSASIRAMPLVRNVKGVRAQVLPPLVPKATGDGGNGGQGGSGGGGGDGKGDGSSGGAGDNAAVLAVLAAASRTAESLPQDLARALAAGKLNTEILQRFLALESHPFLKLFLNLPGFRDRLLADNKFMAKLGFEVLVGVCTKVAAELERRRDNFKKEFDFVFANIVMAIIADFMLVYVPAPTVSFVASQRRVGYWSNTALARFLDACPGNAFQRVPPGADPYTLAQRGGAILKKGITLFGTGIVSSLIGVSFTNALIFARQLLDPEFTPLNRPQNVLFTSLAYGTYMAHNSNLRYQIVAGVIENRILDVWLRNNPGLNTLLSFVARTVNTFCGSLMWVDFARWFGFQKAEDKPAPAPAPVAEDKGKGKKGGKAVAKEEPKKGK